MQGFYGNLLLTNIFSNFLKKWYYYVILIAVIGLIVLFLCLKKPQKRNNLTKTQKIAYIAVLSALSCVANIFSISVSNELQISLVATVGFLSGYLLGAGEGFAVCFIGDLIGALIMPRGVYNPIIAIGTGLWGFIPGVIFSYFCGKTNKTKNCHSETDELDGQSKNIICEKKKYLRKDYIKLIISYLICVIVISGLINTLGIYLMYGLGKKTFLAYFITYPWKILSCAVNAVVSWGLMMILKRILPKGKFNL